MLLDRPPVRRRLDMDASPPPAVTSPAFSTTAGFPGLPLRSFVIPGCRRVRRGAAVGRPCAHLSPQFPPTFHPSPSRAHPFSLTFRTNLCRSSASGPCSPSRCLISVPVRSLTEIGCVFSYIFEQKQESQLERLPRCVKNHEFCSNCVQKTRNCAFKTKNSAFKNAECLQHDGSQRRERTDLLREPDAEVCAGRELLSFGADVVTARAR